MTGYEKTDMGKKKKKNLAGSPFKIYPDPYTAQQLFYRSDNATLARQGVPAHSISTSKMDAEKFYHTLDDEYETLDMKNMTEIIRAIALSSSSIVSHNCANHYSVRKLFSTALAHSERRLVIGFAIAARSAW